MNSGIRVVHMKKEPFDIYIGRGSIWGNPYIIGRDGNREEVLRKYKGYLKSSDFLINRLPSLIGKTLGHHCAPNRCHGDILKEAVESEMWKMGAVGRVKVKKEV